VDGFKEDAGGGIQGQLEGSGGGEPAVFTGFFIEFDAGFADADASVVQEDEVGLVIEFRGVDAVLDEDELDVLNGKGGFLHDLTAEGGFGGFPPFDLAARDAPEAGPFVDADHEDVTGEAVDEGADGGEGGMGGLKFISGGLQVQVVLAEDTAEFAEVLGDEVGTGGAELLEGVVAGQDSAGVDAAVFGGVDVVFHIADEEGFAGVELVFDEDFVDGVAFIEDTGVGAVEVDVKAGDLAVDAVMVGMGGTEEKGANFVRAAEFKEFAGVGEFADGDLGAFEFAVEPFLQLAHGDVRGMAVVKFFEREGEFGPELFEGHGGLAGAGEDVIGGLEDGGQVVHEGARPVENDVANHGVSVRDFLGRREDFSLSEVVTGQKLGVLIAFNKPFQVLSQFTPDGSPNRLLAEFGFPPNVYPIGRLDADSEGLLLLSDEAALNERLLHPRHAHEREYWAQVERIPTAAALATLAAGVLIQGRRTLGCRAWHLDPQPWVEPRVPPIRVRKSVADCWIGLELVEGKNRQVRRMTAAIGHPTLRLLRVRIGQLRRSVVAEGQWKELTEAERRLVVG